jgi:DNA-directed RNA polymerase subunit RPC12/RpoP
MGLAVKGGQWCMACSKPVAGQKTTHRARGAAGLATGFWSLAIGDGYHCPDCGGVVATDLGPGKRPSVDATGKVSFDSPRDGTRGGMDLGSNAVQWIIAICVVVVIASGLSS